MVGWNLHLTEEALYVQPPQWEDPACCCPLVFRQWRCCWRERHWSSSVYRRDSMYTCCIITTATTLLMIYHHCCLPLRLTKRSLFSHHSPTPMVKWMKMGDKMAPRNKVERHGKLLTISAVEERDGGKYMCTAENSAGEEVHYFDVIVEGRSTPGTSYTCICWLLVFGSKKAIDTGIRGCFDWDQHCSA